ncbi:MULTISPECIES: hypothetical protein [unclassified Spirosoma]|uniref:hypothetical protein n=1 Tax=unclassified Spirosoma TaxID=2621999 RepID=UPI00095E305D|nr:MULTISPECIES: hypothetical protein [unclassified Spirosoma]MBN8826307.1 hypothetical protein [Spirosoma sp.]OJW75205.1 MAG: hypothetical protein BGO59_18100 [Spirosoma sp. 48-14]
MRHILNLTTLLALSLVLGCDTYPESIENNLYEAAEVKGEVYIQDTFKEQPEMMTASEAVIYLTTIESATPYLYSTKADKDGKFTLTHTLKKPDNLSVVGRYADKNGLLFEGKQLYSTFKSNPKLILEPQYPGGKIRIKANDLAGQPLNEAIVYLFSSRSQAESIADKPVSFVGQYTTNSKGVAVFYNLDENREYYVAARKDELIASPTSVSSTTASPTSITSITLTKPAVPTPPTQLTVVVVTSTSIDPVFKADVHVFTSEAQAASLTMTVPSSVTNAITDQTGTVRFSGLNSNTKYYVAAKATLVTSGTAITRPTNLTAVTTPGSVTLSL